MYKTKQSPNQVAKALLYDKALTEKQVCCKISLPSIHHQQHAVHIFNPTTSLKKLGGYLNGTNIWDSAMNGCLSKLPVMVTVISLCGSRYDYIHYHP